MSNTNPPASPGPAIVAPLSRFLAVASIPESLAFYRDVLGFEVRSVREENGTPAGAELVSGPACIQLNLGDRAADSTGVSRPRGSAMLFFESDDVAALHDIVTARGGKPSDLEKVNWIKMRMFQVRDPDGHALWFGQSFDRPESARDPRRQLRKALPELPWNDVPAGVKYYCDVLGFHINYAQHDLGVMDRDDVTVLLIAKTEEHTGIGSCYIYVNDADALHAELCSRGANVLGEPVSHPWGLREFSVFDFEGNQITFGQPFE